MARWRAVLSRRIFAVLPGDVGAVAGALIDGDQSAISEPLQQAYRESGLAHLLSISGLHISVVAGIVLFAMRFGLALVEPVALRYPIKKWAALPALLATYVYALLAGWTAPPQRSFLMIAAVLVAVLLDRRAISLRSVALSALVILAVQPESLANPSFSMSYGAVTALVAAYEASRERIAQWRQAYGWLRCPRCGRAGLPPEHMRVPRPPAPGEDVLIIGPERPDRSARGRSSFRPGSFRRIASATMLFLSLLIALFSLLEQDRIGAWVFTGIALVCLAFLVVPARPREL